MGRYDFTNEKLASWRSGRNAVSGRVALLDLESQTLRMVTADVQSGGASFKKLAVAQVPAGLDRTDRPVSPQHRPPRSPR